MCVGWVERSDTHQSFRRRKMVGYASLTHHTRPFSNEGKPMEDIAARRAAPSQLAAHKANVQFKTLGPPDKPATVSDAYDIQDRYVALLRSEHGDAVGYKVGLTSATMQKFCGIDHPIAGVVLASPVHRSAPPVAPRDFARPGL